MKPNPMSRNILVSEDIDQASMKTVIKKIIEINEDDDLKEQDYKDWVREPIYLFLNTYGGEVYSALALADIITQSKTPIYTVALGSCMSAGLIIFCYGHKRLVCKNATLMFHDISTVIFGKIEEIRQEAEECERLNNKICSKILEISEITQEDLEDYIVRKAEWYIPAEEAIDLKLATGYYN